MTIFIDELLPLIVIELIIYSTQVDELASNQLEV